MNKGCLTYKESQIQSSQKCYFQKFPTNFLPLQVETKFEFSGSVMWASPTYQTISTSVEGVVALWSTVEVTDNFEKCNVNLWE